jgi:hypothetical protein
MIKATGKWDGKDTLFLGLSFDNLDKFRDGPLDTFITISGKEMGLAFDVVIFSGRTEEEMAHMVAPSIGPGTTIVMDDRLKN